MPRRPSNRVDIEADDAVEDPVMRVAKIIIGIVISVAAIVAIGLFVAYFVVKDKAHYHHFLPIIFVLMSLLVLCGVIFLLSKSDSRAVRNYRRCYRNLRRIMRLIRIPAFCTRYLRGRDPHREVTVNTINVRPGPTPSIAGPDYAFRIETPRPIRPLELELLELHTPPDPPPQVRTVQIETPSPIRPLQPRYQPRPQDPATNSIYDFAHHHLNHPNRNIPHQD